MEARVYAEDPFRNFLPSTGTLSMYQEPPKDPSGFVGRGWPEAKGDGAGVRVDAGVREGSAISMFYDPMICKLVTYGATRQEALDRLKVALDKYIIRGVGHNVPFLRDLCEHERFVAGRLTTGFIEEEYPDGFTGVKLAAEQRQFLAAVGAVMQTVRRAHEATVSGPSDESGSANRLVVTLDGQTDDELILRVDVARDADGAWVVVVNDDDASRAITFADFDWRVNAPMLQARAAGSDSAEPVTIQMAEAMPEGFRLQMAGATHAIAVRSEREHELAALMPPPVVVDTSNMLVSPMPGMLVSVAVEVGDVVEVGQELAVVEAMKMANVLRSEKRGVVKAIPNPAGSTLAVDDIIIEFEAPEE